MNRIRLVATADKYAEAHGAFCPACQSSDIEGGTFEADNNYAWRRVKCLRCGASWNDVYKLTGYNNLMLPENWTAWDWG